MTNLQPLVSIVFAIAIMSLTVWGCSSNLTSPPKPLPSVPTVGSTLTQVYFTPGDSEATVLTVDSATITDPNSSGAKVITLVESTIGQEDSTYQSFEPDGDIALSGQVWRPDGTFSVIPFATASTIHTSYVGAAGEVDLYAMNNGAGSLYPLNGASYSTDSATVLQIIASNTTQFHYTYIPSLGIVSRMVEQPSASSDQDGISVWIIAYAPK